MNPVGKMLMLRAENHRGRRAFVRAGGRRPRASKGDAKSAAWLESLTRDSPPGRAPAKAAGAARGWAKSTPARECPPRITRSFLFRGRKVSPRGPSLERLRMGVAAHSKGIEDMPAALFRGRRAPEVPSWGLAARVPFRGLGQGAAPFREFWALLLPGGSGDEERGRAWATRGAGKLWRRGAPARIAPARERRVCLQ